MSIVKTDRKEAVTGRFAPSPTGPLHLGSLVAAVGSYVMAMRESGQWLVRIEDLDAPRVIPGMSDDILRTLELFGLHWDREVVYQSRRIALYEAAVDSLVIKGVAYPCGCSRAEIARISTAPHGCHGEIAYPGTCRSGLLPGKVARSIRVRAGDDPIEFSDCIMGTVQELLADSCGDFVVRRADGPFAYHLAVVVDDEEQGVTQVVRGMDLLPSTGRQIHLQRLLGYGTPQYCHLPLVSEPGGGKLSKSAHAVSISAGIGEATPGTLIFSALRFLGQAVPEELKKAKCSEILAWGASNFDPALVPRTSAPLVI